MAVFVPDIQFRSHIQEHTSDNCSRFLTFHFISRNPEFSICPLN